MAFIGLDAAIEGQVILVLINLTFVNGHPQYFLWFPILSIFNTREKIQISYHMDQIPLCDSLVSRFRGLDLQGSWDSTVRDISSRPFYSSPRPSSLHQREQMIDSMHRARIQDLMSGDEE